ncbi:hypothetical protein D3C87_1780540 [compost metagenome]
MLLFHLTLLTSTFTFILKSSPFEAVFAMLPRKIETPEEGGKGESPIKSIPFLAYSSAVPPILLLKISQSIPAFKVLTFSHLNNGFGGFLTEAYGSLFKVLFPSK